MPSSMAACGCAERDLLAVPGDRALVGLVGAGEHLDQGGLAGAVLAEQAVHLAGADVEVDAVEGPDAGERLTMPRICEQRLVLLVPRALGFGHYAGSSSDLDGVTCVTSDEAEPRRLSESKQELNRKLVAKVATLRLERRVTRRRRPRR